ncbi:MAG: DUF1697 domain-containing protein [Flavobacteriaceae bacterium]
METYVVLLRGINVGGHKKIKMAELRTMLEKHDFKNVRTYIQSGNVVLNSDEKNAHIVEQKIQLALRDTFGFDVPVLVKSVTDLNIILRENPFQESEDLANNRVYFVLLQEAPATDSINSIDPKNYPSEQYHITNACVYLLFGEGFGNAKLNTNELERKLKVSATARNYRTMTKLLELTKEN